MIYANCISSCLCVHMAWPGQETWGAPGRWEEDGPAAATWQRGDAFANGEKWRTWFLWDDLWTKMFRFDWINPLVRGNQTLWRRKTSCLRNSARKLEKGFLSLWLVIQLSSIICPAERYERSLHFLLCFTMSQSSFWVIALAVLVSDSCLSDVEAEACPVRCRKMGVRRQEGNSCRHHESLVQSHGAHRTSASVVSYLCAFGAAWRHDLRLCAGQQETCKTCPGRPWCYVKVVAWGGTDVWRGPILKICL